MRDGGLVVAPAPQFSENESYDDHASKKSECVH